MYNQVIRIAQIFIGKDDFGSTISLAISNAITRLVGLVMPFILINLCDEDLYGKFAFVLNTLATIIAVFSTAITGSVSRYLASATDNYNDTLVELELNIGKVILFAVGLSLLVFTFGERVFSEIKELRGFLTMGLLYVLFTLIAAYSSGVLLVHKAYKKLSRAILISSIIHLLSLVIFTYLLGIWGALISYIFFTLVQLNFIHKNQPEINLFLKTGSLFNRANHRGQPIGIFLQYMLPTILASIALPVSVWVANNRVVEVLGFKEMGFISIALQMQVLIGFLPGIFNSMYLPGLSKAFKESREVFKSTLVRLSKKTLTSAGLIFALLFAFATPVLSLYSESYVSYASVLRIFLFGFLLNVLLNILGVVIMGVASMWWGTLLNVVWAVAFLLSCHFLLSSYGLMGFAFSYLLAYGLHLIFVLIYAFYFFKKVHYL